MKKLVVVLAVIIVILIVVRNAARRRSQVYKFPRPTFPRNRAPIAPRPTNRQNPLTTTVPSSINVGYTIVDLQLADQPNPVTVAVWYPTSETPSRATYNTVKNKLRNGTIASEIKSNANIKKDSLPYPLIIFLHGDLTCGTQSVFLTEYLARQGFIVAAPDFPDNTTICRIRGGGGAGMLEIARELRNLKTADTEKALSMIAANGRVPGTSKIIDQILQLNKTSGSFLFGAIDEAAIGLVGHSYGGETILGLTGGYPGGQYTDGRVRAAVILSGAVFPFQDNLSKITLPLMVMQGDDVDDLDLHDISRKQVYDRAAGPKFFLKLQGGTHGSFYNEVCAQYSTVSECQTSSGLAKVINDYSVAFLKSYLKNDAGAQTTLQQSNPLLKIYEKK